MQEQQIIQHLPTLDAIVRPTKDAVTSASILGVRQARYLVDTFYQIQEARKAASNQIGAMERSKEAGHGAEPHETPVISNSASRGERSLSTRPQSVISLLRTQVGRR